jgi:S-DNA-T family DNA segregation ATPase FtsK/SpoIIIE
MLGLRVAPVLSRKLLLSLNDRNDYLSAGLSAANLPARFGPGRAVSAGDGREIQLALLTDDDGHGAEQAAVRRISAGLVPTFGGPAIRLRSLPASIRQADLSLRPVCHAAPDGAHRRMPDEPAECLLGVGGDDAQPIWAQLFVDHARFLISGPPRSGRSTTAVVIGRQALQAGLDVLVAAPPRSLLAEWASEQGLHVLVPNEPVDVGAACDAFTGQLVLIDDAEQFTDTASGSLLTELAVSHHAAVIAAARSDDLAATFRGPAATVRRRRTGLLLQPSPADGDLLGIRVGPHRMLAPPGRGLLVTDTVRRSAPDGLALQVAI